MKERPILFSGPMVRAILEGRKTQTRRIVKNVRQDNSLLIKKQTITKAGITTHVMDAPERGLCPYGKKGDRLWVRETFSIEAVCKGWQNPHVCDDFEEPLAIVIFRTEPDAHVR